MFVTVLSVAIIHEHRDSVVIYTLVFPASARYWVTRYRTNMASGLISERLIFSYHKRSTLNPLNAELNPICHLLALLGAHHILHVSRIRVNVGRMWTPLLVIITFLCLREERLPPLLRFFKLRLPLHFAVLVS